MNYIRYESSVGMLTVYAEGGSIVGILSDGCKYPLADGESAVHTSEDPTLKLAADWLDRYFRGEKPESKELPLAPQGNDFRRTVWELLCEIPYGECVTYGELAREYCRRTGKSRMSAQAIGGAVGHNPIVIVIPCHRVIGADGSLTGYAGGLEVKRGLLELEGFCL